jgi:hypothetical protein
MTKIARLWLRCFATASLVVGPIFVVIAIGTALHTSHFIHRASQADGIVAKLTARRNEDSSVYYVPTFAFKTPTSQLISIDSDTGSNPPGFAVGDHVRVLFDPNDPQNAKIATNAQLWLFPIVSGAIGILFTPIGIFLLRCPQIATAPILFWTTSNNA